MVTVVPALSEAAEVSVYDGGVNDFASQSFKKNPIVLAIGGSTAGSGVVGVTGAGAGVSFFLQEKKTDIINNNTQIVFNLFFMKISDDDVK